MKTPVHSVTPNEVTENPPKPVKSAMLIPVNHSMKGRAARPMSDLKMVETGSAATKTPRYTTTRSSFFWKSRRKWHAVARTEAPSSSFTPGLKTMFDACV